MSPFCLISNALCLAELDVPLPTENKVLPLSQKVVDAYYDNENSNRDLLIQFRNKTYTIEYFNNVDEANVEIELQAKEVLK